MAYKNIPAFHFDPWERLKETINEYDGKLRKHKLWEHDIKAMTPHGDMIDCVFPGDEVEYGIESGKYKEGQKGFEGEEYSFPNPFNSQRY